MIHSLTACDGMVVAPHHLAAQAGLDVLKDGGTAVEACVTVAATLAVVYPHMTGIGGDGFWLVHEPDGRVHAIDACGGAAARADRALYAGHAEIPWRGPLAAITVAGTVSGWEAALDGDGGTMPLARLLRDPVRLARASVPVTTGAAAIARDKGDELRVQPGAYSEIFEPEGRPLRIGDLLRQPALADTFEMLASRGLGAFYQGPLAQMIAADLALLGSPLTLTDLGAHRSRRPAPLSTGLREGFAYNTAPPTQGLASLLILALFDRIEAPCDSFAHVHALVEATKHAFRIRDTQVGDPDATPAEAQDVLDDLDRLDALAASIDMSRAAPWPNPFNPGDTTWFAAADRRGQVVSCIQSTYFEFGSGLVLPQTGIVWQNRGASFRLSGGGPNLLAPGRRPFHTLNPALAKLADGRVMAYGTMGGDGQPQTQAAIFTRHARYGMPLQQAVTAPRWLLGRTWGETSTSLKLEGRFPAELVAELIEAGHEVDVLDDFTSVMGHAGAIVRHPTGVLEGASDPRSDGSVAAW